MEILLSEQSAAKMKVNKGIRKLRGDGLILSGDRRYQTKAFKQTNPHMDFDINVGVGNVTFKTE